MERQQARREIEMMPLVWARRTGFNSRDRTATVQIGNASRPAALNMTLRIYQGQLPGPPVTVGQPIIDDLHPQEEQVQYPADNATQHDDYIIEARYETSTATVGPFSVPTPGRPPTTGSWAAREVRHTSRQ